MPNQVFAEIGTSIFEEMSRLSNQLSAINLGQGFPEALEPAEVIEAAVKALRDGPHQYPPMMGLPTLRQAVAENAERFFGLKSNWETEVLITSGATEALADSFFGLLNPGDEIIVFQPAYDCYNTLIKRAGAIPVPVRLEPPHWELPREKLLAAITPKTRAIILNNPMNPSGKLFTREELTFLADLMNKHDLVAICDEVYEHLTFDGKAHLSLAALPEARDRVVRIGSAGKAFSVTGWKVGYITAPAALLAPISRAHQYITFTTPPALQTAVAVGLRLPTSYFDGLRQTLQQRRDFLAAGLKQAGYQVLEAPSTYFLNVDIAGEGVEDDFNFCRQLVNEAGVAAVPVSTFYAGRDMKRLIRFCFAKKQETLETALARLTAWKAGDHWRLAS